MGLCCQSDCGRAHGKFDDFYIDMTRRKEVFDRLKAHGIFEKLRNV
jgi:hypothetical protein